MQVIPLALKLLPTQIAYAHCDIPCGIYDPKPAQLAAATILKMVQKINEIFSENATLTDRNNIIRMVWTKEEHGRILKHELMVLWADYFKEEHLEKFPRLHDKFWKALKLVSKNKQAVDENLAKELVKAVDEIAEIFTQTKLK